MISIQTVRHSDIFLKEFFEKVNFEKKKSADYERKIQNYPACLVDICRQLIFFKINFFEKLFQKYHQSVIQFGIRSGPTLHQS